MRCGVEAVAERKAQTGALQTCEAPFLPAPTLLSASLSSLLTRTVFISCVGCVGWNVHGMECGERGAKERNDKNQRRLIRPGTAFRKAGLLAVL